jgi:hypothetical protein
MHTKNGHTFVDLDFKKELKKDIGFDEIVEDKLYSVIVSEENEMFALAYGKTVDECEWNGNLIESSKELVQGIEDAILMFTRLENESKKSLKKEMRYLSWKLEQLRDKAISKESKQKFIDNNKPQE